MNRPGGGGGLAVHGAAEFDAGVGPLPPIRRRPVAVDLVIRDIADFDALPEPLRACLRERAFNFGASSVLNAYNWLVATGQSPQAAMRAVSECVLREEARLLGRRAGWSV